MSVVEEVTGAAERFGRPVPRAVLEPGPGLAVRGRQGGATGAWNGDVYVLWEV